MDWINLKNKKIGFFRLTFCIGIRIKDTSFSSFFDTKRIMIGHILIIDDDSVILSLLKSFLSLKKYNVECATSGQEALKILRTRSFDIIIMDMVLNDMLGSDLLLKIKRLYPDQKIIGTSGDQSHSSFFQERDIPFLFKPFKLEDVERIVKRLI